MAPHVAAPAVLVVAAASLTAAGLALLGRHAGHVPGDGGGPAEEPPPADLIMATTAILGALGAGLTVAISGQQVLATHLARTRRYEEKLAADAAAAVAGVGADYIAPLRRERLAAFLRADPIEHARAGACEVQALGRLYSRWALALRLTEEEADEAHDRALAALLEDYSRCSPEKLGSEVRKAARAAKAGTPSTLDQMVSFIARTKSGSIAVRGGDTPMSRSITPA